MWEQRITDFLNDLSDVQRDLLRILEHKRDCLAAGDIDALDKLHDQEDELNSRLLACQQRRTDLLEEASQEGLPAHNVAKLAAAISPESVFQKRIQEAAHVMRLLQHHALTNWVIAQKSLLHLSQVLAIIAGGGRTPPTYAKDGALRVRGSLIDQQA